MTLGETEGIETTTPLYPFLNLLPTRVAGGEQIEKWIKWRGGAYNSYMKGYIHKSLRINKALTPIPTLNFSVN
jgi:hypothetical protein